MAFSRDSFILQKNFDYFFNYIFNDIFTVILASIWTSIFPYSVRMPENTDQNNFEYGYFPRSVCL